MKATSYILQSKYNEKLPLKHFLFEQKLFTKLYNKKNAFKDAYSNFIFIHDEYTKKLFPDCINKEYVANCFDNTARPLSDNYIDFCLSLDSYLHIYEFKLGRQILAAEKYFELAGYTIHKSKRDRAAQINEELRKLRLQLKNNHSNNLLLRVKELVQELHTLVFAHFYAQKKLVRKLHKSFLIFKRDIRRLFRSVIRNLFKLFNDFSGCEEDAVVTFYPAGNNYSLTNNYKNHVQPIRYSPIVGYLYSECRL